MNRISDHAKHNCPEGCKSYCEDSYRKGFEEKQTELEFEIDRLKELIEHERKVSIMGVYLNNPTFTFEKCEELTERDWEQFKTENNL